MKTVPFYWSRKFTEVEMLKVMGEMRKFNHTFVEILCKEEKKFAKFLPNDDLGERLNFERKHFKR